ncbi:hypothetical protein GCM10007199_43810 [Fictibacillus barbaricus]|nr:hypothetical protein GCM10007199_43810 [Fictibacillus barbaricus]
MFIQSNVNLLANEFNEKTGEEFADICGVSKQTLVIKINLGKSNDLF